MACKKVMVPFNISMCLCHLEVILELFLIVGVEDEMLNI